MSQLRAWATGRLDRLVREGSPTGPGAARNLLLHDQLWRALDPEQVSDHLRRLRQAPGEDNSVSGRCAVAFERPWHGQPAVWIEAVDYHQGRPRDSVQLVQSLHGGRPAVAVPAPATSPGHHPPLPPAQLPDAPVRQAGGRPPRSTRATFWWSFWLGPWWFFGAMAARRRADARGEDGTRHLTAWVKGWACGVVVAGLLWIPTVMGVVWLVTTAAPGSNVSSSSAGATDQTASAGGQSSDSPSTGTQVTDAPRIAGVGASCVSPTSKDAAGNVTAYNAFNAVDDRLDTAWRCDGSGVGVRVVILSSEPGSPAGTQPPTDKVAISEVSVS
jgi:hypothetical protein